MKNIDTDLVEFIKNNFDGIVEEVEVFNKIISFCQNAGIFTFQTNNRPDNMQDVFGFLQESEDAVEVICQWIDKQPPICVGSMAVCFPLPDDDVATIGYELYIFHQGQVFSFDFGLSNYVRNLHEHEYDHIEDDFEDDEIEEDEIEYEDLLKIEDEITEGINDLIDQVIGTNEVSHVSTEADIIKVANRFYTDELREKIKLCNEHLSYDYVFREDFPYQIKSLLKEKRENELVDLLKDNPKVMFAKNDEQRRKLGMQLLTGDDLVGIEKIDLSHVLKCAKDHYEITTLPSVVLEKRNTLDEKGKEKAFSRIAEECGISVGNVKKILGLMGYFG